MRVLDATYWIDKLAGLAHEQQKELIISVKPGDHTTISMPPYVFTICGPRPLDQEILMDSYLFFLRLSERDKIIKAIDESK